MWHWESKIVRKLAAKELNRNILQMQHKVQGQTLQVIKSTESTDGRAYMQIYNGWQAQIQVFELEGRSSARSPARSRAEPGGGPGYEDPRKLLQFSNLRALLKSCIFMSILSSPIRTVATVKN